MYEIVRGPLIFIHWVTFFAVSLVLIIRFINLYRLSRTKDAVLYDNWSWKWALRSIVRWLIPFGSESMKNHPFVTMAYFSLHATLFAMPVFISSHIFFWKQPTQAGLWLISDRIADVMTIIFVASILFIAIRRAVAPEVRILTTVGDYLLLALVAAMFITGYAAYHRWIAFGIDYKNILIVHILLGELLMILIPFTKLGHMILFFFTRAIIGVEFGARRGAKAW
jgi:nitrate reductase gamma subunit